MVFLGEMKKFDSTACKHYVAMLDAYKSACASERAARKTADVMLKKSGQVAMFAKFVTLDYDEQFPGVGSARQVAYLSQKLEQVASKLKDVEDASAAEAEETALKLESEKEALQEAQTCRSFLEFISTGDASLKATQEEVLAEYLASRRAKSGPGL